MIEAMSWVASCCVRNVLAGQGANRAIAANANSGDRDAYPTGTEHTIQVTVRRHEGFVHSSFHVVCRVRQSFKRPQSQSQTTRPVMVMRFTVTRSGTPVAAAILSYLSHVHGHRGKMCQLCNKVWSNIP